MTNNHFSIDSIENPIDSLETTLLFLERDDNLKWKWIIFALHHSLYIFCIANLVETNNRVVLKNYNNEDKRIEIKKGDDPYKISKKVPCPIENCKGYSIEWDSLDSESDIEPKSINLESSYDKDLIGFWTAIARVQDGYFWMSLRQLSKPLELSNNEWISINKLLSYRNDLHHFKMDPCMFDILELKSISLDIIRVIEFLALKTNKINYSIDYALDDEIRNDNIYKNRIKNCITKIREFLV